MSYVGEYGKRNSRLRQYPKLNAEQRKMVADSLWVARKISWSFAKNHDCGDLSYDDLYGAALWGLCVAATSFDESRGSKFSTYSWVNVRGAIQHEIRDRGGLARLPRLVLAKRAQVLELDNQGKSNAFICKELKIKYEDLILCRKSWKKEARSIEGSTEEYGDMLLGKIGPSNEREKHYKNDFSEVLREAAADLSDEDVNLVLSYLGVGKSRGKMQQSRREKAEAIIQRIKKLGTIG